MSVRHQDEFLSYSENAEDEFFTPSCSTLLDLDSLAGFSDVSAATSTPQAKCEPAEYSRLNSNKILYPPLNLKRIGYYGQKTVFERNSVVARKLPTRQESNKVVIQRLFKRMYPDCIVSVGDSEFRCHLIVLQVWSKVADNYELVTKISIPRKVCTPDAFKFIYKWMLFGLDVQKNLDPKQILDVLSAAEYMEIPNLINEIWQLLYNQNLFIEYKAFQLYLQAKRNNMTRISKLMFPRIKTFFIVLVCSQDWLELDIETVTAILKSSHIEVGSEMEIFLAGLRWLLHDWDNRCQHSLAIMHCIRFANIQWWQLLDIKRNTEHVEFRPLIQNLAISRLIDDAIAYQIYEAGTSELPDCSEPLSFMHPIPRSLRSNNSRIFFTYREFLIFLDQIRRRLHVRDELRGENV